MTYGRHQFTPERQRGSMTQSAQPSNPHSADSAVPVSAACAGVSLCLGSDSAGQNLLLVTTGDRGLSCIHCMDILTRQHI